MFEFLTKDGFTQFVQQELPKHFTLSKNLATVATSGSYNDLSNLPNINTVMAASPSFYQRATLPTSAKTTITIPSMWVNINDSGYVQNGSVTVNLATASSWDASTYATAANRAGKDFYIYAVQPSSGTVPKIILSANSTVPTGYTASNSRKIGGFHCLCADVGTISGHTLSGYVAGNILPASIWDLYHRPVSSPEGMVWSGREWVDIYLASWNGSKLVSVYGGTIADGYSSTPFHGELFAEKFGEVGKHLISRDSFMHAAKGSNEMTNIYGSSDPGTAGGHKDTASRRMISNIGCEDCCGALWQWTSDINGSPNTYQLDTTNKRIVGMPGATAQTESAQGDHWVYGYGWQSDGRGTANIGIDGAMNKYGLSYGGLVRALVGGRWDAGSYCGSRSAFLSLLSSRRHANCAGRGASEPRSTAL